MLAIGVDNDYASTQHDLYSNLNRHIRLSSSYGTVINPQNGLGQGDSFSLIAALALVSIQFQYVTAHIPTIRLGSVLDDRNVRGQTDDVIKAFNSCKFTTNGLDTTTMWKKWQ